MTSSTRFDCTPREFAKFGVANNVCFVLHENGTRKSSVKTQKFVALVGQEFFVTILLKLKTKDNLPPPPLHVHDHQKQVFIQALRRREERSVFGWKRRT